MSEALAKAKEQTLYLNDVLKGREKISITIARVDERLIHGQIVNEWILKVRPNTFNYYRL